MSLRITFGRRDSRFMQMREVLITSTRSKPNESAFVCNMRASVCVCVSALCRKSTRPRQSNYDTYRTRIARIARIARIGSWRFIRPVLFSSSSFCFCLRSIF
ncbi:hypothetical protein GQ42DRAFT_41236 [Ramicandelaber brevisporus]|nr:hypothetical protein GQ42DRAFT_41236 [Ramicandelaber brevisporus]